MLSFLIRLVPMSTPYPTYHNAVGSPWHSVFSCTACCISWKRNSGVQQVSRQTQISNSYHKCTETLFRFLAAVTFVSKRSLSQNINKSKLRSRLTDNNLHAVTRVACSRLSPNIEQLASDKKCNISLWVSALHVTLLRWRTWEARIILVY